MPPGYIYKLVCRDENVKDTYIGSCWNMYRRNDSHKSRCHNNKSEKYNYPVYQFIRENGGYENWGMVRLDWVECEDNNELRECEQHYIDIHGGIDFLLNQKDAFEDKEQRIEKNNIRSRKAIQRNKETKKYYCVTCNHAFPSNRDLNRHFTSNKHKHNLYN